MQAPAFPPAFEERMRQQLAEGWTLFAQTHQLPSPVSIRINRRKISPENDIAAKQGGTAIPWSKSGYYLPERPSFTLDPLFHAGTYYVQEASSMLLEQAVQQTMDHEKNLRVLDLCAAPGGKSTHLLSLLNSKSLLVSNDVIRTRAAVLAENILKWGSSNVIVTNNDPEDFSRLKGFFDLIVVDAPCSGEGLFRKDQEAMREWSPDNANLCSSRQRRILADVWPALKENGILIYCTCTYNPEENDRNLKWLQEMQEAEIIKLALDSNWGIEEKEIGYQCYPHRVRGEGFYISVLRKMTHQSQARVHNSKSTFSKAPKLTIPPSTYLVDHEHSFVQFADFLLAFPQHLTPEIEFISSQARIVSAGTTLGTIKHSKLVPDHALALSVHLAKDNFPIIAVTKEEAIAYLRKDVFWKEGLQKGYSLIEFQGSCLGWVNVLDNRLNNLYPSDWRIRMAVSG